MTARAENRRVRAMEIDLGYDAEPKYIGPPPTIREWLLRLCRIQDRITHLNEAGERGSDLRALTRMRAKLIDDIASHVEALEEAKGVVNEYADGV